VSVAIAVTIVLVVVVASWYRVKHPEDVFEPGESPAERARRLYGPPPTPRARRRGRWLLIACAVFAVVLTAVISSLPDDGGDCNTEGRCVHWTYDQP
jgi:hypothetical protein